MPLARGLYFLIYPEAQINTHLSYPPWKGKTAFAAYVGELRTQPLTAKQLQAPYLPLPSQPIVHNNYQSAGSVRVDHSKNRVLSV